MSKLNDNVIPCWVYRSSRKDAMYLYLAQEDDFENIPKPLLERFGQATLVMKIELHSGRTLAREEITKVMANLRKQGFHLQLPPDIQPHLCQGE